MRRHWRHNAILREESFIVHNGGYEVYVDFMSAMEIYTWMKLKSCDALSQF